MVTTIKTKKQLQTMLQKEDCLKLFQYKGFICMIRRRTSEFPSEIGRYQMFHLCGYVGLPEEHQLHNKGYDEEGFPDLDIHGGITFADSFGEGNLWFLGFDCAHMGDQTMLGGLLPKKMRTHETYKDMEYVTKQLKQLVDQLQE